MFALKKKLEANLNERLKVRETEHNKLLKRYQNVKREIEKQHNIERNKFDKSMQGYISKNAQGRPGTATQRGGVQGSRMMTSRMQGSKMPASQPSKMSPMQPMKMTKSRGIDWADMARRLPTSKTDPQQIKMRAEYWKGFDNNGNGYVSLAETEKGIRDVIKLDNLFDAKPAIMRAF